MLTSVSQPQRDVPPPALTQRVVFLDVLRFIAVAAVLAQHSLQFQAGLGRRFCELLSPGVFGVVLFFVISGFVIPMTVSKVFVIKTFIIRRFLRIYPLLLFALSLSAIAGWIIDLPAFEQVRSAGFGTWIANVLLIQDYAGAEPILTVTWTLNLEFVWYICFALSFVYLGRRFDSWLSIAAPVSIFFLVIMSIGLGHRLPLGRVGLIYAAIFGCRIYYHLKGQVDSRRLFKDAAVFFAVTTFSNIISFGYYTHPTITVMQAVVPWVLAPAMFIIATCVPTINRSKLFNTGVLAWLGTISFSIYLLHPLTLATAQAYCSPEMWIPLGLLLTVLISLISYHLIEAPGQALGRRLTSSYLFRNN